MSEWWFNAVSLGRVGERKETYRVVIRDVLLDNDGVDPSTVNCQIIAQRAVVGAVVGHKDLVAENMENTVWRVGRQGQQCRTFSSDSYGNLGTQEMHNAVDHHLVDCKNK